MRACRRLRLSESIIVYRPVKSLARSWWNAQFNLVTRAKSIITRRQWMSLIDYLCLYCYAPVNLASWFSKKWSELLPPDVIFGG